MQHAHRMISAVLELEPVDACRVNGHCMRTMHGSFMANLDGDLRSRLHDTGAGPQPFTVSLLMRGDGAVATDGRWVPGEPARWRLTGLTGELCTAIEQLAARPVLEVDRHAFKVTGAALGSEERGAVEGWARRSSYVDLFRTATDLDRVVLSFASATAFKAGDAFVPFPLADSVFGGYLAMWRAFGNVDLDIDAAPFRQLCRDRVWVDAFHLRTQSLAQDVARPSRNDRPHVFTGFVGSVSYRLDRLGERGVRALNVLADFAMYCGTGSKKAQGAGQTRRVR